MPGDGCREQQVGGFAVRAAGTEIEQPPTEAEIDGMSVGGRVRFRPIGKLVARVHGRQRPRQRRQIGRPGFADRAGLDLDGGPRRLDLRVAAQPQVHRFAQGERVRQVVGSRAGDRLGVGRQHGARVEHRRPREQRVVHQVAEAASPCLGGDPPAAEAAQQQPPPRAFNPWVRLTAHADSPVHAG